MKLNNYKYRCVIFGSAHTLLFSPEDNLCRPHYGVNELLLFLAGKKILTAVISNRPDFALRRLLADNFPSHSFDVVCGLGPGVAPKPDPASVWEALAELGRNPHEAIFIGGREVDIETAINSGCYPLGASWGGGLRSALEAAGAAHVIDKPDGVVEFLHGKNSFAVLGSAQN